MIKSACVSESVRKDCTKLNNRKSLVEKDESLTMLEKKSTSYLALISGLREFQSLRSARLNDLSPKDALTSLDGWSKTLGPSAVLFLTPICRIEKSSFRLTGAVGSLNQRYVSTKTL